MPRTGWRKRTPWPRCDCLPPQFDAGGCGTHRPRLLIHTATPLTQWPTGTDGGHHPQTPWREAPTSAARTRRLHSHTQARLLHHRSLRVETRHPRHADARPPRERFPPLPAPLAQAQHIRQASRHWRTHVRHGLDQRRNRHHHHIRDDGAHLSQSWASLMLLLRPKIGAWARPLARSRLLLGPPGLGGR